ncbi:DUF1573 domain-containing protein [candidate division KSB1 bacterium]
MRPKILLFAIIIIGMSINMNAQDQSIEKRFPFKIGNLRLKYNYITFNQIKNTEIVTDTLEIYNEWDYPMKIGFVNVPDFMTCFAQPETLKSKEEGILIVTMNATKRNDYGFLYNRLTINTNDSVNKQKGLNVSVYIKEDFSHLTPDQLQNAPKVVLNSERFNFGTVKDGDMVKYSFIISNEGNEDLIIRKTKASCGCTASKPEKTLLKKGETSKINITFNTTNRPGKQHKTVTVITNDPKKADITLHIEGTVEKKQ